MAWSLRTLFGRASDDARMAASPPAARFSVDIPPEMLEAMRPEAVDPRVSRAAALQVPAVLRSRNLIAGTLATLPLRMIRNRRPVDWPLFEQPDPNVPTSVVFAYTFEDLLFEGIGWWRVTDFDAVTGFPVRAYHVPAGSVHVGGSAALPSQQRITPDHWEPRDGQVYIDGQPVDNREVIQFLSPNPPLLVDAARAIRTALRLDRTAALYADEPMPLGYFTRPEGAEQMSDEDIGELLDEWAQARKQRAWGYVGALEPHTLGWDPEKLQLADQRQHAVLEIARAAGVDAERLGVSTTSRTYANSEQERQDLLDFTLSAYVSAFQDRLSMRDVAPAGHVARMKFDGFLRSTTLQRMQAYEIGERVGAYTEDEVRELEDRLPLTAAQKARIDQRNARAQPAVPPTEPAMSNGHRPSARQEPR